MMLKGKYLFNKNMYNDMMTKNIMKKIIPFLISQAYA